jgi:hypothetical protein
MSIRNGKRYITRQISRLLGRKRRYSKMGIKPQQVKKII